jgi:hypothetical protein
MTQSIAPCAELTDKAAHEREWGRFPALWEILGKKEIPWHYYGATSVSDNRFDATTRLMEIAILIRENRDEITAAHSQELREELRRVAEALEAIGRDFLAGSREVAELAGL